LISNGCTRADSDTFRTRIMPTQAICAKHRCPVKWISVRLIVTAVGLLTREMRYDVPSQDLAVDLPRIPAIPTSGFVISNVSLTSSTWRMVIETLANGSTSPAKPVNDPTASPLRNSTLYF
jgi:hypothetical protein